MLAGIFSEGSCEWWQAPWFPDLSIGLEHSSHRAFCLEPAAAPEGLCWPGSYLHSGQTKPQQHPGLLDLFPTEPSCVLDQSVRTLD